MQKKVNQTKRSIVVIAGGIIYIFTGATLIGYYEMVGFMDALIGILAYLWVVTALALGVSIFKNVSQK